MKLSPAMLGLVRGLGYPVLVLVLTYFSTAEHLSSLGVSASVSVVLAGILGFAEHAVEAEGNGAFFGAIKVV